MIMPSLCQSFKIKANYLPWIAILLIVVLFVFVENRRIFTKYDPGFYSSADAAEIIATKTVEGSIPHGVSLVVLGLFGLVSLWRPSTNRFQINGTLGFLLLIFFSWAALSISWAEDPSLAFRKVVILGLFWLGALGFAYRYSLEDVLWLAFLGSAILVVSGLLGELSLGTFTPFSPGYRFSGGLHPNHQGWTCGLLLITSVVLGGKGKGTRNRFFFLFTGLLALLLLILTRSRIATASTILVLLFYWYLTSPQRRKIITTLFGVAFICLLYILLQHNLVDYTKTAVAMGRTDYHNLSDLTGRVPLWEDLSRYASRRTFAGYGFNAFWTPEHVLVVSKQLYWGVPGAHSGILDLVLGVGIIGATLFLIIIFATLKTLIRKWKDSYNRLYLFSILLVIFYLSIMLAEEIFSSTCFPGFIFTIILMKFALTTPRSYAIEAASQELDIRELALL